MKMSDRRFAQRFSLRIPVFFRDWKSFASFDEAITANVSERGILFLTNSSLHPGSPVQLRFRMPQEITGVPDADWDCAATIVRVQPGRSMGHPCSVGVRIDYYEVSRPLMAEGSPAVEK